MPHRRTTSGSRASESARRPSEVSEEDTDEHEPQRPPSVQRVHTPAGKQLAQIIDRLDDSDLPPEFRIALTAIRERLDEQAKQEAKDRQALEDQIARVTIANTRWSRLLALAKGISVSAAVGALLTASSALIHRGETAEVNRRNSERLEKLGALVETLQDDLYSVRAQTAANRDLLLRVRLGAPATP